MAWYSSPPLAYSIYLPMALVATALPYALTQHTSERALPQPRALQSALLGYALVISLVAGLSVALGMGSGYLFAAWGLCALLAAGFVTLVCSHPPPNPPHLPHIALPPPNPPPALSCRLLEWGLATFLGTLCTAGCQLCCGLLLLTPDSIPNPFLTPPSPSSLIYHLRELHLLMWLTRAALSMTCISCLRYDSHPVCS